MIDSTREIVLHAIDLHEDLIEMPATVAEMAHGIPPAPSDLSRKDRPEPGPPEPDRFMGDIDPPLVQQVLHIPQRQRISDVHHHGQADDLRSGFEVAEDAGTAHTIKATGTRISRKPIFL